MSSCCARSQLRLRGFAFYCVFLLIWAGFSSASPAQSPSALDYCNNAVIPWQCTSTTETTVVNQTVLPAIITVPAAFGSLSNQLALAFASPGGPALQQLLAPFLAGTPVPQEISSLESSSSTLEAGILYDHGEDALIGPDKRYAYPVPLGQSIFVVNTRTDKVVDKVYQLQQVLDAPAANSLTGDVYAIVPTIVLDGDQTFIATLFEHAARNTPGATGTPLALVEPQFVAPAVDAATLAAAEPPSRPAAPAWKAWLDGGLSQSALSGTADYFGLRLTTAETAAGADYADGPWRAGGSLGFARTGFQQSSTGDSGSVDSLRVGVYAGYDAGDWSLTGGLSGGYHWTQATRLSGMPAPAAASFGSTSVSAGVEAAQRLNLWDAKFEPFAGAVLSVASSGGFTEAGSTGLEIVGQPSTTRALTVYGGGRISAQHRLGDLTVRPEAHLRLLYDVLGEERALVASFGGGTPMQVAGLQPGRLTAQIGAGLGVEFSRNWHAAIAGELQFRNGSGLAYRLLASAGGTW